MDYANMFLVPLKPVVLFVQWIRLHTDEEMCTQIGYIKKHNISNTIGHK